jgi:protoporphyrinogen oxidase
VVIVGAGPAGLTAAYALATQTTARVTVLEAEDAVGGLARTVTYKGCRFDLGGHRFFTTSGLVQRLWREMLGEELQRVPRLSRIAYDGCFFDYPLTPLNALRGLGVRRAVLVVMSYLKARVRPSPIEQTFEQWVTNRFGRRLYETFFKTYTEKVWGLPCSEIGAEWAAQRIQGLSLGRAILHATALHRRSSKIKTLIHEFDYPRLGPGQMWEACRARVTAAGHAVRLQCPVAEITVEQGRAVAVVVESAGGREEIAADHVITTMPLGALACAIRPHLHESVRLAADRLQYRDFILVALMLRRPNLFPDTWIYVHTPGVRVGRVQNFNNWGTAMVSDPGTTCLGMEYFCTEGDDLWVQSDADLIALATSELDHLTLADGAEVIDAHVVRVPKAYPVYDREYSTHVETIRQSIDGISNVHTVGRNGMHKYNNQDHSMLAALAAVNTMLGERVDPWAVNTDSEYHEEQRVAP